MLGNRGFPEAWSRLCVCQASFLMTFAMGGVPHPAMVQLSYPLKRISSNTTVQKHQFFGTQLLHSPTLTSSKSGQWMRWLEMTSLTRWTWVWVNSRSWWWTGRPDVLRFMGSQRVGQDWATELNWIEIMLCLTFSDPTDCSMPGFSVLKIMLH